MNAASRFENRQPPRHAQTRRAACRDARRFRTRQDVAYENREDIACHLGAVDVTGAHFLFGDFFFVRTKLPAPAGAEALASRLRGNDQTAPP